MKKGETNKMGFFDIFKKKKSEPKAKQEAQPVDNGVGNKVQIEQEVLEEKSPYLYYDPNKNFNDAEYVELLANNFNEIKAKGNEYKDYMMIATNPGLLRAVSTKKVELDNAKVQAVKIEEYDVSSLDEEEILDVLDQYDKELKKAKACGRDISCLQKFASLSTYVCSRLNDLSLSQRAKIQTPLTDFTNQANYFNDHIKAATVQGFDVKWGFLPIENVIMADFDKIGKCIGAIVLALA